MEQIVKFLMQLSTLSYYFSPVRSTSFSTHFLIADMDLDTEYANMGTVIVRMQSLSCSVTEKTYLFEKCGLERTRYFGKTYYLHLQDQSVNQTKPKTMRLRLCNSLKDGAFSQIQSIAAHNTVLA